MPKPSEQHGPLWRRRWSTGRPPARWR